ncbi:MAG: right-handed parallel beta-helix repeat-containing protein [bacterium]|jgi:hypothetical protein
MWKMMLNLPVVFALVLAVSLTAQGQNTVNVGPGDNIAEALAQVEPGGTLVFAPGWYDLEPENPESRYGIHLTVDYSEITLQGAGPGTDPTTATILDGDAWFLGSAFRIEGFDIVIDGFTIINIWDDAFEPAGASALNIEIRNCWVLGCDSGADNSDTAGIGTPNDFSDMIRYVNCIFARGGDDGTDLEGDSAVLFRNCDFYDWDSDIMENVDNTTVIVENTIFHAGSLSDDIVGGGILELRNCLLWDPKGSEVDGPGGIALEGNFTLIDTIAGDPLYVNVGPDVHYLDLDFHLNPGSPALTLGKDENGNETFAGSQGPAQ